MAYSVSNIEEHLLLTLMFRESTTIVSKSFFCLSQTTFKHINFDIKRNLNALLSFAFIPKSLYLAKKTSCKSLEICLDSSFSTIGITFGLDGRPVRVEITLSTAKNVRLSLHFDLFLGTSTSQSGSFCQTFLYF